MLLYNHAQALKRCEPAETSGILLQRATAKIGMGDAHAALQDLIQADSIEPLDFKNLKNMAELHSTIGDVATAVATFNRAACLDPTNARIRQQRGACKTTLNDFEGGQNDLTAAIELGLGNALTYKYRGVCHMLMHNLPAALADMDVAIRQQPDRRDACVRRAEAKHYLGDHQGAVQDMKEAHLLCPLTPFEQSLREVFTQALSPQMTHSLNSDAAVSSSASPQPPAQLPQGMQDAEAEELYRYADARHSQQGTQGALAALDRAAQLAPGDPRMFHERAHTKMGMHDYHGALQDLQILAQLNASWDQANISKMHGVCHCKLGNLSQGLQHLDAAVRLLPRDTELLQQRSVIKLQMHDYAGALLDINASLESDSGNPQGWHTRACVHSALEQHQAALQDMNKADSIRPDHPDTLGWRGLIKGDLGDFAGAIADFDRAEQLEPLDYHCLERRTFAKKQLGLDCNADPHGLDKELVKEATADPAGFYDSIKHAFRDDQFEVVLDKLAAVPDLRALPEAAQAFRMRGFAHFMLGVADLSMQDLEQSIALQPDVTTSKWLAAVQQSVGHN